MSSPEIFEDGGFGRRLRAAHRVGQSWLTEFKQYRAEQPNMAITLAELGEMHTRYSIAVQTMQDVNEECVHWLAAAQPGGGVRLRLMEAEMHNRDLRLLMADEWGPMITATLGMSLRTAPDLYRAALVPVVGPDPEALKNAIADVLEDMELEEREGLPA